MSGGMRVVRSLDEARAWGARGSVVTLGVFDGVHRGHDRIIRTLIARREETSGGGAYLLTFDPHPAVVTGARAVPAVLTTIDERLELLSGYPLDGVFVVPFDDATRRLDYRDFIEQFLLGALGMEHLVLGYDCHFGHGREGSPERVAQAGRESGFEVEGVDAVSHGGNAVSSTTIRDAIRNGRLDRANDLLGHPYLVAGTVVAGEGRGRDLGFPTANVRPGAPAKLWPPRGVYAVRVLWRRHEFAGMMNVGSAPTLKGGDPAIEVHLFDFSHALYGERISVYCEAWLRSEQRFSGVDALIEQLGADREAARAALAGLRPLNT